jgi:predicted enzyme related to lactoylglutathione lyase
MTIAVKYVHTNLIAEDWRKLAAFYQNVFGCVPQPPERNFQGATLEAGTGIPGAHLRGIHLRLPGFDASGPTLEIFSYTPQENRSPTAVNRPGFGHIAFQVEDVPAACEQVLLEGGKKFGEVVTLTISTSARVTWCYMTDPEGNLIELQAWEKQG